jgi:predicted kinase
MEDLKDGKKLLNILKPKSGAAPAFGEIPFDQIIFDSLKEETHATTSASPKVLILCGPPGCGKSTVKRNLLAQNSIDNYINIDPDEIRTVLMENGVTFPADKTTMPGITNNFNKRMSDEAQKQRLNIVFDTTGQNFRAVSDIIYTSQQLGYKTIFVIIWASKETCLRRVDGRNQHLSESGSGRIQLPLDVAEGIYNGFIGGDKGTASMLLLDYPVKADEVFLYNNNVDRAEPQLLYKKVGTTVEQSIDFPGFYNMNILSTEPYITKASKGGKSLKSIKKRRKSVKKTKKRRNFNKSKRRFR